MTPVSIVYRTLRDVCRCIWSYTACFGRHQLDRSCSGDAVAVMTQCDVRWWLQKWMMWSSRRALVSSRGRPGVRGIKESSGRRQWNGMLDHLLQDLLSLWNACMWLKASMPVNTQIITNSMLKHISNIKCLNTQVTLIMKWPNNKPIPGTNNVTKEWTYMGYLLYTW